MLRGEGTSAVSSREALRPQPVCCHHRNLLLLVGKVTHGDPEAWDPTHTQ